MELARNSPRRQEFSGSAALALISGGQLRLRSPLFIEVLKNISFYFYSCVCVSACHICAWNARKPEDGIRCPGAALTGRVGILVRVPETNHRSSGKSESCLLNHLSDFN